jgi:hypothetical protein
VPVIPAYVLDKIETADDIPHAQKVELLAELNGLMERHPSWGALMAIKFGLSHAEARTMFCRNGHERSKYTYTTPGGQKHCRACDSERYKRKEQP